MYLRLAFLLLGVLPVLATAGVYKWVDADGTVHYSDVPKQGAEEVHVAPPQTYQAPKLPAFTPRPEAVEEPAAYSQFGVVTPDADETIWDNTGTIIVNFTSDPPLQADRGHRLIVLLDGQAQAPVQDSSVTLENIERGSHTLQGQIVDARGKVLISSQTITVHLHRQSKLFPQRAQPKPSPTPK